MIFRRRDGRDLETVLRASRPEPSDEFVDGIVRRTARTGSGGALVRSRRLALGFAAVLTAALVAPLAAFGGFSSAASSVRDAAVAAKNVVAGPAKKAPTTSASRTARSGDSSAATDQYHHPHFHNHHATPQAAVGQPIASDAELKESLDATGTITFTAQGPNGCASPVVFSDSQAAAGDRVYYSGSYKPNQPGTYGWTATYSGDDNNEPTTTGCAVYSSVSGSPTHVHLQSVTAKATRHGVVVRWRTGSETDIVGYRLYRVQNGRTSAVGGVIAAAGKPSGATYSVVDRGARSGKVTYRIQAITRTGQRFWLGTVSVSVGARS